MPRYEAGGSACHRRGAGSHRDADTDAGAYGGTDADTHPGTDAGADAGSHAGTDPGTNAGSHAGTDPGAHTGADIGTVKAAEQQLKETKTVKRYAAPGLEGGGMAGRDNPETFYTAGEHKRV